ncbi:hypothetical protein CTAYLR_000300 [Chrysophaeum taylorii]|uniref:peptidylprolyl isomerase n=1 Tax=Chrysophaeum taylorii TaxID=2483200 RepID=A0AAD7UFT7_9STRA|nr:hypothetical protein CTAYLR_000300 [Chrysophaeum taylorii]
MLARDELEQVERTIRRAVKQRNIAREKKRFDVADELRELLLDLGVELSDTSGTTTTWEWKELPEVEEEEPKKKKKNNKKKRQREEEAEPVAPEEDPETKPEPPKKRVLELANGVSATVLREGVGPEEARKGTTINVKYAGVLAKSGRQFDAGKFSFTLGAGDVIKGWDVGCVGMKLKERRRLTIPPKMAYGARGAPPDIPKNATLVFDVTLLKV